ncbi:MAG: DUF4129 domain-containing protein [Candidatus Bathyarchaeia archaeon]
MRWKSSAIVALLVLVVVTGLLAPSLLQFWKPTKPIYRHVDPRAEAEQLPLPIFLNLLVVNLFDRLLKGDLVAMNEGLNALNATYIPERFRYIVNRFMQLMDDTAALLNYIENILDQAEDLIGMGKGEDAKILLRETSVKIASANVTFKELKSSSEELAGALRLTKGDLYAKIDALDAFIEALHLRLLKLLNMVERQTMLEETSIEIEVEPNNIWTGGSIRIDGKLYAIDGPLGGRAIQIIIDGAKKAETITVTGGYFNITVALPYIYKNEIAVQARYVPQGSDSEVYKPTASNVVKVSLLYVKPMIRVQAVEEVLPGKSFTLKGYVEAEMPIPYSEVKVSWAGVSRVAVLENGKFETTLYTPENIPEGGHILVVETPAWGVFAPAEAKLPVTVRRLPINITLQAPHVVFAGLTSALNGRVIYEDEQFNVTVKGFFAGESYTTNSRGEFRVELNPPLTTLTGYQDYELYVTPDLPWYRGLVLKGSIFTINPLIISVPASLIPFFMLRLLRGRSRISGEEVPKEDSESKEVISDKAYSSASGLEWLIDLYWQAVVIISGATGIEMKPSQTLREYLNATQPKLGKFRSSFEALTRATEKALYSPTVSLEELESAKKAALEIKVGHVEAGS